MILRINISARSNAELLEALKRVDISVPSLAKKQRSEFRERWSMYRLLATLCKNDALTFPVICNHDDKPDFYLLIGKKEIGIECTDAIHEDYAHAKSISEKHPGSVVDPDLFRVGERKPVKEIHDIAKKTKLTGPGCDGNESQPQWVKGFRKVIDDKTIKLREINFKKYSQNELLIFDGLELYAHDINKSLLQLKTELLQDYWSSTKDIFNTIIIERGRQIYRIWPNGKEELLIFNLWTSV